jgi:hypothetical protein
MFPLGTPIVFLPPFLAGFGFKEFKEIVSLHRWCSASRESRWGRQHFSIKEASQYSAERSLDAVFNYHEFPTFFGVNFSRPINNFRKSCRAIVTYLLCKKYS